MLKSTHAIVAVAALVSTLLAAAEPAGAQTPPRGAPIKLGLIDIYSGGFTFIADTIRTGFQIAIDEANQAGGVGGRSFALVTADMAGSVEKAVTEARRMILDEQIKYVTIGIHSGAAVAAGGLAKQHKVLVIGGFATTKRLTGEVGNRLRRARQPQHGGDRAHHGRAPPHPAGDQAHRRHLARLRVRPALRGGLPRAAEGRRGPISRSFARSGPSSGRRISRPTSPRSRPSPSTWWWPACSAPTS